MKDRKSHFSLFLLLHWHCFIPKSSRCEILFRSTHIIMNFKFPQNLKSLTFRIQTSDNILGLCGGYFSIHFLFQQSGELCLSFIPRFILNIIEHNFLYPFFNLELMFFELLIDLIFEYFAKNCNIIVFIHV